MIVDVKLEGAHCHHTAGITITEKSFYGKGNHLRIHLWEVGGYDAVKLLVDDDSAALVLQFTDIDKNEHWHILRALE